MGPQNALESTGIILVSGKKDRVEALRPALALMTGTVHFLGERTEQAAAFKLVGNLFLMVMTSGMVDMFALAKATGISAAEAATLFDMFNPGLTLGARAKRMTEAKFSEPSWELSMARKDARLMIEEAARANVALTVLPSIAARMDVLIKEGHGGEDWTVFAKDAL